MTIDGTFNILITGIGGTGILTVGSILGMAAHIEQKGTSVLNQTGLAQKFGAVTGHVRIAENQRQIHSVRIPAGEAHLLLGADLVVSAADDALAKLNREHSHAVINSHLSPTADFTRDADAVFPISDMEQSIAGELENGHSHFVRATTLATRLLGDAIFANFFLLGVAYQQGLRQVWPTNTSLPNQPAWTRLSLIAAHAWPITRTRLMPSVTFTRSSGYASSNRSCNSQSIPNCQ
jgi:indolepyruvate ferredoxin oxidoreductase